jgi:hypothetical protein
MKLRILTRIGVVVLVLLCMVACNEELPNISGKNRLYELSALNGQRIFGQVIIRERNDGTTQLEITLEGLAPQAQLPAYIHFNTALEGGGIAITLEPVDGNSGTSVTEITQLDTGTPITYDELLEFDGHLNIQLDDSQGTLVSQGDIGANALTGRFQQYSLAAIDVVGADGVLTVEERESGYSLLTLELAQTVLGRQHPATLNFGSIVDDPEIAVFLNPVDGDTGVGKTNLEQLDGGLLIPYQALIEFSGFVRVHLGPDDEMTTVVSEGNIAYIGN